MFRPAHRYRVLLSRLAALVASIGMFVATSIAADVPGENANAFQLTAAEGAELCVADDLRNDLVLQDPLIANPLHLSFDERGRLWVVQYRQYPWPAGLKLLSRDNVWRNVYDPPFPPAPPHAADSKFRGADRITIHEDTNHDGQFDTHRVFVDGLNFATAALVGRGGVFVMNPPRLLFYPDRDRDDRPDDPEPQVLLSGFGIEDSHSIANSLRWGPDGWIYATQGSTVSASVVVHGPDGQPLSNQAPVHSLGQNVWRYHPESRRYEVFGEGGGNSFGVEIDRHGRIYSGHNGGNTRGFYYVQGGYSQKNFGKHGQLSNPFAFAYYPPMAHHSAVRFTHTFCIYEAAALPPRYQGRLIGVNPVEHEVIVSAIEADGASRRTQDIGTIVKTGDAERADWFTPVDIQLGPDGALYLADWYSVQANHYFSHEGQTNPKMGRVYRLRGTNFVPWAAEDLGLLTSDELIDRYLFHANRWFRHTALRLLGDRRDHSVADRLWTILKEDQQQPVLEALWALHLVEGLSMERIEQLLEHADPHVRRWTIRLLGDQGTVTPRLETRLVELARHETDVETRCQLAATAKRLPAEIAVPVLFELVRGDRDPTDPFVPNMLWWALEAHAERPDLILAELQQPESWQATYRIDKFRIPENLMRRYAGRGRQSDLAVCAKLLEHAPSDLHRRGLTKAFTLVFAGRSVPTLPPELAAALAGTDGPFALQLGVRRRRPEAVTKALQQLQANVGSMDDRVALVQALGDVRAFGGERMPLLLDLLEHDEGQLVRAALLALQKLDDTQVPDRVLHVYPHLAPETRQVACQVLSSRVRWAERLLTSVAEGQVDSSELDAATVQRLQGHRSPSIEPLLAKLFPQTPVNDATRDAQIDALEAVVRNGRGDPLRGRELFRNTAGCSKCHQLFADGGDIGPDLTSYNRTSLRRMLLAIVHPSAEIREGFENYTAYTQDGRILSGLKIEHNDNLLVLRSTDGQNQVMATAEIDEIVTNPQSLMPDGLLNELNDEQIRDLFAYLTSTTPPL